MNHDHGGGQFRAREFTMKIMQNRLKSARGFLLFINKHPGKQDATSESIEVMESDGWEKSRKKENMTNSL